MAKKSKNKKNSKKGKDKKIKQLTKEEIKDLKQNLLVKSDNKNEKVIKSVKKKEKEKKKEIKKEKIEEKIIKYKIKKSKEESIEEEEEKKIKKIKKQENGGDILNKNIKKEKNKSSKEKEKENNQTLLQILKNKENTKDVTLNDENYSARNKNNIKKVKKKNSIDTKTEEINQKNQTEDKNEYIKKLKSKIIMVNGKMVMEKPDVGLINKKYNEEHYKNISPMETILVNNEEKVVNSLSFIDIKPTKKWTEEENKLFYKALELFGLDFSMIEIVLKKRTREEIKRKFLKEKKENFNEIEKAINSRKNIGKLKQILELYKNEKGQNNLGLFKEESFRSRRNISTKDEKIDYDKEYKNILNNN